jgi:hypothetical protein
MHIADFLYNFFWLAIWVHVTVHAHYILYNSITCACVVSVTPYAHTQCASMARRVVLVIVCARVLTRNIIVHLHMERSNMK